MPKSGKSGGKKNVHKTILKDERKMARGVARKEVGKARKIVQRRGQWTVAAGAMGYHGGYDSKEGFFARKGHLHGEGSRGVGSQPVGTYSIPSSSSYVFRPFYTTKAGPRGGLIVCGCQNIGTIASTASSAATAFVIGGARVGSFFLSPDDIGGPMALDARKYTFYRFKKVKIIFPMNAPATDSQNVCIAYLPDPAVASFQTLTYDTLQQSTDLFVGARKQLMGPIVLTLTMLNKAQFKKYNTEIDTTDSMSIRACRQGAIFGLFDAVDTANLKYGDIVMEYELELFDRSPDYGFTVSIADPNILSKLFLLMRDEVMREEKRGSSVDEISKKIPKYASQLKHLDRYVRSLLPRTFNDPRYGAQTTIIGPSERLNGGNPTMLSLEATEFFGTIPMGCGPLNSLSNIYAINSGGEIDRPRPVAGACFTDADTEILGMATSTLIAPGVTGAKKISDVVTYQSAVANITGGGGLQTKESTASAVTDAVGASVASDVKEKPVKGDLAIVKPEVKYSANAAGQLPLLRSLQGKSPADRRKAMKDIVTFAYDTIRVQWPPFVKEYTGEISMIATQLVEMAKAEARKQDDSSDSDVESTASFLVVSPSPTRKISYGEFNLSVDERQYQEYMRLRQLARVAQRSYSVDPSDSGRKIAMSKCQNEIVAYLGTLSSSVRLDKSGK